MQKKQPKTSLIVAVYNQARNLELIFETIRNQTYRDIEVIVADDGSSDGTDKVIECFKQACPDIRVELVDQEDMGFRKTMILNKAIKKSTGEYLIFIDGDMLLEKHFIELHLSNKSPNHVLCGYRGIKLAENYTEKILEGELSFNPEILHMFTQWLVGNVENPFRAFIIYNPILRKLLVPERNNLSGCNFSLYREAIEKVNGFNEGILEHGFNDYELGHRLKLAGYKIVNVSKLCNTYHLYHPTRKTRREETRQKIAQVDQSTEFYCPNGLVKSQ